MRLSATTLLSLAYIPKLERLQIQNLSVPGWRDGAVTSPFGELRAWGKKLRGLEVRQYADNSPEIKVRRVDLCQLSATVTGLTLCAFATPSTYATWQH